MSDTNAVLEFGRLLPVEGLEVLVTRQMVGTLKEAARLLCDSGLRFPVVHAPKRVGVGLRQADAVGQLDEAAAFAAAIGAAVVVLHLWDLPESDRNFDERLKAAVVAADVAANHNITIAVETIPCEERTPLANLERVLAHEPRAGVTLDTEFLAMHDELDAALEADWLWSSSAVRHIHLKDYDGNPIDGAGGRRYLLPGDGSIDFAALFDRLRAWEFGGSVALEAGSPMPDGRPDIAALARVIGRISRNPWCFE